MSMCWSSCRAIACLTETLMTRDRLTTSMSVSLLLMTPTILLLKRRLFRWSSSFCWPVRESYFPNCLAVISGPTLRDSSNRSDSTHLSRRVALIRERAVQWLIPICLMAPTLSQVPKSSLWAQWVPPVLSYLLLSRRIPSNQYHFCLLLLEYVTKRSLIWVTSTVTRQWCCKYFKTRQMRLGFNWPKRSREPPSIVVERPFGRIWYRGATATPQRVIWV